MKNKKNQYESDEKKSIIIAVIVSVVVIVAMVLAFFAVKKYQPGSQSGNSSSEVSQSDEVQEATQGNIVVCNQQELDAALADLSVVSILFQTEEEQDIVIPEKDYRPIEFMIDAPYTNVTNSGIFSKITIYRVDSNTWTEKATGNSFLVDASACHMVVSGGALVKSIEHVQTGSTLAIESQGIIELLALEADSSIVSVQTDGSLRQMQIYRNTNVKLSGSQQKAIGIEVEYGADGTVVNCDVPVGISSFASSTLYLKKGAESSEISIKSQAASVQVINESEDSLKVTEADGTESKVGAMETFTFASQNESGEGAQNNSSGNTAGNGSSGSSSGSTSGSAGSSGSTGHSSGSASSSGTTSGNKTYVTSGYSKEQVDQMVASAVEAATKDMLNQKEADALVEKAVKEATEKAKQEATTGMITQEKAQELIQEAVKDTISQDKVEEIVKDAVDSAVTEALSKPMIVSFTEEPMIYAGEAVAPESGTVSLPPVEELVLPQYVYGHTFMGEVYKIPVISWQNTDQYSQNASAGTYRFTAILQTIPECNVAGGVRAYVTVFVKPSGNKSAVTYKDKNYEGTITVSGNDVIDSEDAGIGEKVSYYYITNNSDTEVTYVALNFYYYDVAGKTVKENSGRWYGRYLQPGESCIAHRENPCMEYAGYFVEVDAGKSGMEPAVQYCETEMYYMNEQGAPSETTTGHLQMKIYKEDTAPEISQCSVTFLFIGFDGKGQRVVLGTDTISTGRKEISSINNTDKNTPIVLDITPPEGTEETVYTVMGGYAIVEQTKDETDTKTEENTGGAGNTEVTENNTNTEMSEKEEITEETENADVTVTTGEITDTEKGETTEEEQG